MTDQIKEQPPSSENRIMTNSASTNTLVQKLWTELQTSAKARASQSALIEHLINSTILDSPSMAHSMSHILSHQHLDGLTTKEQLSALFLYAYEENPELISAAALDLNAIVSRDPAASDMLTPYLYFKGFHAIQTYRVSHHLWTQGQTDEALLLQNRSSLLYGVDIHPAAQIGTSIMLDHATGLVIGETAVVEDHVSMLHGVTLGGTGNEQGDRHPKVREGVMIGAGAKLLGNIEIGTGACIAAGSVVLGVVPAHTTVAGVPAKIIGTPKSDAPAEEMDQVNLSQPFDTMGEG